MGNEHHEDQIVLQGRLVVKDGEILKYAKKHFKKTVEEKAMPALGMGGKFAMVGSTALVMNVII
jgi:hypothetical protein